MLSSVCGDPQLQLLQSHVTIWQERAWALSASKWTWEGKSNCPSYRSLLQSRLCEDRLCLQTLKKTHFHL